MYDTLLDTYDPPSPESGRTKGIVKSLRVRAKTLAKCVSELTDELSMEQVRTSCTKTATQFYSLTCILMHLTSLARRSSVPSPSRAT